MPEVMNRVEAGLFAMEHGLLPGERREHPLMSAHSSQLSSSGRGHDLDDLRPGECPRKVEAGRRRWPIAQGRLGGRL